MKINGKHSRSGFYISRDTDAIDNGDKNLPNWLDGLEAELEKSAVKSKRDDYALFDQINSILGNTKSKYSTVQEAVEDLKKRTGLTAYLEQVKQASEQVKDLLKKIPNLDDIINNYIKEYPGSAPTAIGQALMKFPSIKDHFPEATDVPAELIIYINSKKDNNSSDKNENNSQLGKMDLSTDENSIRDNDPFSGCMPTR